MNPRFRPSVKKSQMFTLGEHEKPEVMLQEAMTFLHKLEDLRRDLVTRDTAYVAAKQSGDKDQMEHYQQLASIISQKCLDYSRDLCDQAIPHWVDGNLSKEKVGLAKHAYDVVRHKMCASLNVFDNDLLPNAHALITFCEGRL